MARLEFIGCGTQKVPQVCIINEKRLTKVVMGSRFGPPCLIGRSRKKASEGDYAGNALRSSKSPQITEAYDTGSQKKVIFLCPQGGNAREVRFGGVELGRALTSGHG